MSSSAIQFYRNEIFTNMQLVHAWQGLTRHGLEGVLDVIRNRVLEFVLALGGAETDAGEDGATVSPETVTNLFHTVILGGVANLAVGSHSRQVAVNVASGDLASLRNTLGKLGVATTEIDEFEAEAADEQPDGSNLGPKAAGWLGSLATKVTTGSVRLAKGIGVELVTAAVKGYFGLG